MALLPVHNYFAYNDELLPVTQFIPSENEGGIYEVVRVSAGIPLFLEEHLERFYHSAVIANKKIKFSTSEIKHFLMRLINVNQAEEGNILISCKINLKAFFIAHRYPDTKMYKTGVECGILEAERKNPNAKVFQTTVRERANKLIETYGFYEVLLEDHLGKITEGSRSNVFFVKKNILITPPGNEVLLGITRNKTISLAHNLNIRFREEDIFYKDLHSYEAAIVTGTSPKILPIRKIEEIDFNPGHKLIRMLMEAYDELIIRYVQQNQQV